PRKRRGAWPGAGRCPRGRRRLGRARRCRDRPDRRRHLRRTRARLRATGRPRRVKYLFDTDTLSNLIKRQPSTALIARLARIPAVDQATSSITLGELIYGAHSSERASVLLQRIDDLLVPNLPVLPFDGDAARTYGAIRARLEQQGTPIGDADL